MTTSDPGDIPEVSAEEAISESAAGVRIIDVREQDEWDAGHPPDATFLPLSDLEDRAAELPVDTRMLIVCHSGMRSLRATAFLRSQGLDAVNVEGGLMAWGAAGGPIVTDPPPAPSHTANSNTH